MDSGNITHETTGFYTGLNQANLIGVVALGNTLDLYANGQRFASQTDSSAVGGEIGVLATAYTQPTEVAFSDAKVWTL
ncbi:MAG TPA: hypothetical protein VGT44_13890 [Ktedonobacteraceae bacterium]|nr:hypothetical protein [Ktedonobacteraceae bacterium]